MDEVSAEEWERADEEVRKNLLPNAKLVLTPMDCLSTAEMRSGELSREHSILLFRDSSNACRRFIPLRLRIARMAT
jgi:hypothetical protein